MTGELITKQLSASQRNFTLAKGTLNDRVVVISGATGGLGRALSIACAEAGATVVLISNTLKKLESLYDTLCAIEGAAQPAIITIDQSSAPEADYLQLSETLYAEFKQVDALVHASADINPPSPLLSIQQQDWSRIMSVNLTSARLLTNACLPLMTDSPMASVTFTDDRKTGAYWGAYGVSKAALRQLVHTYYDETENQRQADGNPKFAFNMIDPGPMRTKLRRKAFPGELETESPLPETCISPYLALISRSNPELNGHNLVFDKAI